MAKKKLSHQQSNDHKPDDAHQSQLHTDRSHSHPSSNMDDPLEKLRSLKNLNALLLKETTERRQQVESLTQDKETLESAFNRSAMEKRDLEFQLSETADDNVGLHLEKGVVVVYVETQMREMGFRFERLVATKNDIECVKTEKEAEIVSLKEELSKLAVRLENERGRLSGLSRERDEMKNEFDSLVAEANLLKEKVIKAEEKEIALEIEIEKLRKEGEKLREEKDEKEGAIRELSTERDLTARKSAETARLIEKLKGEIDGITRAKHEIEEEKNAQESKIIGLEMELKKFNESLKNSLKEEELLRSNIIEFEKSLAQALEKEKGMEMEISAFLKEKKENEESIKMLTEQSDNIQNFLDLVQKELKNTQRSVDEAIRAKNEIEQVKVSRENEIVELQREVVQLKDALHKLKESCKDLDEKNKQLLSEVDHYRNAAEEATLERDNIGKGFDEEKKKVNNLMSQVAGMEAKIEQTVAELGEMRCEREKLMEKNQMMESRVNVLMNEKDVLQKSLVDAQRDNDDLRAKIAISNQTFALLKNTAATLVCHSENDGEGVDEVVSVKKEVDGESLPCVEELDAIKNAFQNKNRMVEDMKQQLVTLKNSAAEAQKKKGLWTVISSATTVLAAALAAYVARGR